MTFARMHRLRQGWFLPLILMAAVLCVSTGIAFPVMHHPGAPGLSALHKAKPTTTAVVKSPSKSSQLRTLKSSQPLDLCRVITPSTGSPRYDAVVHGTPLFHRARHAVLIPARAPPA
jgi:hypothetical protein